MLILSLKTALKSVCDENQPKFFKANFIPLELTILCLFYIIMGRLKCSLCFKKKQAKKLIFALKSLLE